VTVSSLLLMRCPQPVFQSLVNPLHRQLTTTKRCKRKKNRKRKNNRAQRRERKKEQPIELIQQNSKIWCNGRISQGGRKGRMNDHFLSIRLHRLIVIAFASLSSYPSLSPDFAPSIAISIVNFHCPFEMNESMRFVWALYYYTSADCC
jgi:hypothetical protein